MPTKRNRYTPDIYHLLRVTDGSIDEVFIPNIQEQMAKDFALTKTKFGSLYHETWQKVRKNGKWIGIKKINSKIIEL